MPSEIGKENGAVKVIKVEILEDGEVKKGKHDGDSWKFKVQDNVAYRFAVYYNCKDGDKDVAATYSEASRSKRSKTVKKAVIVEYEIDDLFPEGNTKDIDLEFDSAGTEDRAEIIVKAIVSEAGRALGVIKVTDVEFADFESADDSESPGDISEIKYRKAIKETNQYQFFVRQNSVYTFLIRYSSMEEPDFDDSTEIIEKQIYASCNVDNCNYKIRLLGVNETQIPMGEDFNLLEGVSALEPVGGERDDIIILD